MSTSIATFAPPGPGYWQLDACHFPRAVTRLFAEIFPQQIDLAFRDAAKEYGALLETLEFGVVNSFMYFVPRAVAAPKGAKGPPPKLIFKALLRLHPELRRRVATARNVFDRKPWREQLRRWDEETRPATIKAHHALQSIDMAALSDEALLEHLGRCRDHWARMTRQHHSLDLATLVPLGDFLAHATDWTGLAPSRLCALMAGASAASSGGSQELTGLVRALRQTPAALKVLETTKQAAEILAALRATPGEVGASAARWLEMVSYRLQNGLDISESTNLENPQNLVTSIRSALAGSETTTSAVAGFESEVRNRVPAAMRPLFEELLSEARLTYRLRDERGLYSDIWAAGIVRLAVLEAGRRLKVRGKIDRAELLIDAGWEEVRALFGDASEPSSAELTARALYRATTAPLDVPATLGPVAAGPPPFDWMPPATARLERAVLMCITGIFDEPPARSELNVARGLGVSAGKFEGTARVILDVNDFQRLEQGDILITRATTAAFNVVLPLLGAIVTDRGGMLSHTAIVAREYGIPAVVGSREATRVIPDGARICVDGDSGEVRVLS